MDFILTPWTSNGVPWINLDIFRFQQNIRCMIMAWAELPDLIFIDVMMKLGFESLEVLHKCRQVCKAWNNLILRDIYQSKNKRKIGKILKERIEENWAPGNSPPSEDEISNAKWAGKGCLMLKLVCCGVLGGGGYGLQNFSVSPSPEARA